ncbi:MAG: helix-turn-helix domain-containing protein [Alphaproteobacteria bacterium]
MTKKQKRIRRRPEDARALILDAAEASMKAGGPAALRLQDVARAAGVSHPTILHHFGSREGLVRALNLRSLEALAKGVIETMGDAKSGDDGVRRTFETYRDGLAQRLIWLMQSQVPPPAQGVGMFEDIVKSLHAIRQRFALPGHVPDIEDTRAVVHLTAIAAFGDAVIGPRLRNGSGPSEVAQRERFIQWFTRLLDLYFEAAR